MAKSSSSSSENTIFLNLLDVFSFYDVFDLRHNISTFLHSKFQCYDKSEVNSDQKFIHFEVGNKKNLTSSKEKSDDTFLFGKDINLVMERLGIQHNKFEGEELEKKWSCNELCGLFEEEPSLEEVKQAFDVFDQNKDGFIDAQELKRVLTALGLCQGYELQQCRSMIRAFDQNDDGKIDFNDFVRFMLNTL
ncbi:putative calcium-binding protein CML46 [Bienertia sinuspersici]